MCREHSSPERRAVRLPEGCGAYTCTVGRKASNVHGGDARAVDGVGGGAAGHGMTFAPCDIV